MLATGERVPAPQRLCRPCALRVARGLLLRLAAVLLRVVATLGVTMGDSAMMTLVRSVGFAGTLLLASPAVCVWCTS